MSSTPASSGSINPPYPYPVANSDLIKHHNLSNYGEGGYLVQTIATNSLVPSRSTSALNSAAWPSDYPKPGAALGNREQMGWGPGATVLDGPAKEPTVDGTEKRVDATLIYYLITPDSYQGKMHMNLYPVSWDGYGPMQYSTQHFHIHHAGRALYTLIKPPSSADTEPEVYRVVVGPDVLNGELTQLYVPGGWWKASEIPEEDMLLLDAPTADANLREHIGCLISEVVVPGWEPSQHAFVDEEKVSGHTGPGSARTDGSSRRCGMARTVGSRTPSTSTSRPSRRAV